ncbi:MAG: hypothetical protein ACC726_14700 [Chloroflexota bacterium]
MWVWHLWTALETAVIGMHAGCYMAWPPSCVVLLVASTRHNRQVLRDYRDALPSTFPADTPEIKAALRRGRLPGSDGVIIL